MCQKTLSLSVLQKGEQLVKRVGGVFAFRVKDGPGGKEATWVVDVKNGRGSVLNESGMCQNTRLNCIQRLRIIKQERLAPF